MPTVQSVRELTDLFQEFLTSRLGIKKISVVEIENEHIKFESPITPISDSFEHEISEVLENEFSIQLVDCESIHRESPNTLSILIPKYIREYLKGNTEW